MKHKSSVKDVSTGLSHAWNSEPCGVLNRDTYYTKVLLDEKISVPQYSLVRLIGGKLAYVHIYWQDEDDVMKMEVRYLRRQNELPKSIQKKILPSGTVSEKGVIDQIFETTEIDELPVNQIQQVIDLKSTYSCTKLYVSLTGSLTTIQCDDALKTRCYVYSHRLKLHTSFKKQRILDSNFSEDNTDSISGCQHRLETACDQLQLSSIPDEMVGRENERRNIYQTLQSFIVDGIGSPVYLSGLPGMGKTATVKEILRALEHERDTQTIPNFTWIEVNGLHMPKPDQAYSMIWKALEGYHFSSTSFNAKKARDRLATLFSTNSPSRPALVLILDEMDFMLAGKNTVLYNFLEWQALSTSKLLIIGIANIMDLPERLAPKLRSRFGVHRIAFRSYTHDQIQMIIHQRLMRTQVFEAGAIEIYAKTLAHQSGDIRKALMVCKAATEIALRRLRETNMTTQVLSSDIEEAQTAMSQSPLSIRLRQCSTFECIFLVALQREIKMHGVGTLEGVVQRMTNLAKTAGLIQLPSFHEIQLLSFELERSDVLREKKGKLSLTFSQEEIHDAFISHPIGRMLWT